MLTGTTKEKGTLEKSAIFKRLTAKHALHGSHHAYTLYEEPGSYSVHRPYFLFAFESRISLRRVYEIILEYQTQQNLDANEILDAVFILDKGWVINFVPLPRMNTDTWKWEWPWKYQQSDVVLTDMLSWLSLVMPRDMREGPLINWYTETFIQ